MGKYFQSGFYPQNFILLGSSEDQRGQANQIVQEAVTLFPGEFNARRKFFPFELRYIPPFDKAFSELKRLQGTAAEEAGFRDEYRGYIVIDLSAYVTHEAEDYFGRTIKFLHDMSSCWKYIFLVDNTSERAALSLVRNVLQILDDVPCCVIEQNAGAVPANVRLVRDACEEFGITCSTSVCSFLQELMDHNEYPRRLAFIIVRELAGRYGTGHVIRMETISEYFSNGTSVVEYMLVPKLYDDLIALLNQKIEVEHEKAI